MIQLSARQLRQAADLQDKIESLQSELASLLGGTPEVAAVEATAAPRKRRTLSAAARARIAAAQKARWAKQRGEKPAKATVAVKPKRKMSAAARKRMAESAKARWAKAKAEGRTRL